MPELIEAETLELTRYRPGLSPTVEKYNPTPEDYGYMERALVMGQLALETGNTPVGAVLINRLSGTVWDACNTEFSDKDLRGHPEEHVYEKAQTEIGRDLSDCSMYTVAEPCVGCSYFIDKGNIGMLFIGARRRDVKFFRGRGIDMDAIFSESRREISVVSGLLVTEAKTLLKTENNVHHKVA